jgi:hypothetical protein
MVHFSPSPTAKEFFLVVSFSSASFELNEESVGLALQCCIGGVRSGFGVFQTSDRIFHFSVASNKVGHFIYGGLKDHVWPDFICHFSLFRGIHPTISGFHHDQPWQNLDQDVVLAQRSPTKINPKLRVLQESARNDHSDASFIELAKFGFNPLRLNLDHTSRGSENLIQFGSFEDPIALNLPKENNQHFVGISFQ